MKIKKKQKESIIQLADDFGEEYVATQDKIAELNTKLESTKDSIKDFAEKNGTEIGKLTIVEGDLFVVGFQTRNPSPTLDYDALFKLYPKLKAQCMTEVFDPKKLDSFIASGLVAATDVAQCLIQPDPTKVTKAIHVKKKGK